SAGLADDVAVLGVHAGQQVATIVESPADRRREELDAKFRRSLAMVREQRVKANEARHDAAVRAPAFVQLVEALDRRVLSHRDRAAVAVGSGHVEPAARNLPDEAGEEDVPAGPLELQEGRPPPIEQSRALHVIAEKIGVGTIERGEQLVPAERIDLHQRPLADRGAHGPFAVLARSAFSRSSSGFGSWRPSSVKVRTRIRASSRSDQWST